MNHNCALGQSLLASTAEDETHGLLHVSQVLATSVLVGFFVCF